MRMLNRFWCAALLGLACSMTCTHAQAQCNTTTRGFNTVWGCQKPPTQQGSFAMVDAGQFTGDICNQIQTAFTSIVASNSVFGVVVDARGVPPPYSCASGESPWGSWGYTNYPPSVVLLPSGTIPVVTTWIMPANARLIGEGPGATILQAASNLTGDMIDMGSASSSYCTHDTTNNTFDCPGVEIEHLALVGNSKSSLNGIVNNNAQEFSHVEDVAFSNITGTALLLNGRFSQNSGPYSNLTMTNVGICININGPTGTRGIHGLNCSTSNPPTFPAAIYVDASNNSLEDISLSGANTNGILIGSVAAAQNNVLFNISGSGISGNGFTYLIHISNTLSGQTNCPGKAKSSTQVYNVCDVTIMAVTNSTGNTTIKDDVGGPTVSDSTLGMYILGEPVQYGDSNVTNDHFLGNSHFTISPNWPSWVVGPSQTSGASCTGVGTLYSVTSGTGPALWECEGSGSGWRKVTNQ